MGASVLILFNYDNILTDRGLASFLLLSGENEVSYLKSHFLVIVAPY